MLWLGGLSLSLAIVKVLVSAEQGGDVAVFDATNTTRDRRIAVLKRCNERAPQLLVTFVESICDDKEVLESNLIVKARKFESPPRHLLTCATRCCARAENSPDYAGMPLEKALEDLRKRIAEYEKVYEPIQDDYVSSGLFATPCVLTMTMAFGLQLSYIKLINLQSKVICNKVRGRLGLLIATFLMCIHIKCARLQPSRYCLCFDWWLLCFSQAASNLSGARGSLRRRL